MIRNEHNENGIVKYFDIEKDSFRAFKLEKMIRLEVGGDVFNFGL